MQPPARLHPRLGTWTKALSWSLAPVHLPYANERPGFASWAGQVSLFQSDHGFRDGQPTFGALAAMSGTYVAAMEGHTSAWYIGEWLAAVQGHATAAAVSTATTYLRFAGGTLRGEWTNTTSLGPPSAVQAG